jgi:hypothetical protein
MKDIRSMSLTERFRYQNEQKKKKFNGKTDKIVEDLKREFDIRSCVGIDKYKTTLQDNKHDDFLQHLKEELMDAALYIQKLQSNDK